MAATDWTGIRIRRTTLERLYAQRESLTRAAEMGKYTPAHRHDVLVTLDDVLNVLLDRENAKKERAAKSARKKRQQPEVLADGTSAIVEG